MKTMKQALKGEIEKNEKLNSELTILSNEFSKLKQELKEKQQQTVKNFNDYVQTYEELLKLRNGMGSVRTVGIGIRLMR